MWAIVRRSELLHGVNKGLFEVGQESSLTTMQSLQAIYLLVTLVLTLVVFSSSITRRDTTVKDNDDESSATTTATSSTKLQQDKVNDYLQSLAMVGAPAAPILGMASHSQPKDNGNRRVQSSSRRQAGAVRGSDRSRRRRHLDGLRQKKEKIERKGTKLERGEYIGEMEEEVECIDLDQFPQWQSEVGYWIGEYTLLQGDGKYTINQNWPYPYNAYMGFSTGNIKGGTYRQRNVFLYPPQTTTRCQVLTSTGGISVVGNGTCGETGHSLLFAVDQSGCSIDGSIAGTFEIEFGNTIIVPIETTTTLVGTDVLVYKVLDSHGKIQSSQLTTILENGHARVRTNQHFDFGRTPSGTSYYRERKVSKEMFYELLKETIASYNIREEDLCSLDGLNRSPIDNYIPGEMQCHSHLEQSFEL